MLLCAFFFVFPLYSLCRVWSVASSGLSYGTRAQESQSDRKSPEKLLNYERGSQFVSDGGATDSLFKYFPSPTVGTITRAFSLKDLPQGPFSRARPSV